MAIGKAIVMVLGVVSVTAAQSPDSTGGVAGVIYDSIAGRPLAGALIQLVPAANVAAPLISTTSDARGSFTIASLAAGRYLMEIAHQAFDTLALGAPRITVNVRAGSVERLRLAIPSMSTIHAAVCGTRSATDSSGMLIGQVRDARTGLPRREGAVEVQWQELVISSVRLSMVPRQLRAQLTADRDWFVICGLPGASEIGAFASSGADTSGVVAVMVPMHGLVRQDFYVGGSATVRGAVRTTGGAPIADARVGVAGRSGGIDADSSGSFILSGIPAGTQTLDVRALGYVPDRRRMQLRHGSDTVITVTLTSLPQLMDTIQVIGERLYDRDRSGFLRRQRAGFGHFMDEKAIALAHAIDAYQLMNRVPGVWIGQQGFRRMLLLRDRRGGHCVPQLFVDGMRVPKDMSAELESLVHPRYLRGVETYRGLQAPSEYTDFQGCGSVLLWTRPPPPKRPKAPPG